MFNWSLIIPRIFDSVSIIWYKEERGCVRYTPVQVAIFNYLCTVNRHMSDCVRDGMRRRIQLCHEVTPG